MENILCTYIFVIHPLVYNITWIQKLFICDVLHLGKKSEKNCDFRSVCAVCACVSEIVNVQVFVRLYLNVCVTCMVQNLLFYLFIVRCLQLFFFPPFKFLIFFEYTVTSWVSVQCVYVAKAVVCEHLLLEKSSRGSSVYLSLSLSLSLSWLLPLHSSTICFFCCFFVFLNQCCFCMISEFFFWNLRGPFSFGVCET